MKYTTDSELASKLVELVGEGKVADQEYILASYSMDVSPEPRHRPDVVVRPFSTEEVSKIVRFAFENSIPVVPTGGRTSMCGASIPQRGGILLDMTGMQKVIELNKEEMYVTVECGITWGHLISILKEEGFKLGFRGPYSGTAATVGGSISSNSIGYGSCRWGQAPAGLLGLTVVLPNGNIARTGSQALIYANPFNRYNMGPDLTGLFCGDHGTLGVKTEATLSIHFIPEHAEHLAYGFEDVEKACQFFCDVQKHEVAEDIVLIGETGSLEYIIEGFNDMFPGLNAVVIVIIEENCSGAARAKAELVAGLASKHGARSIGDLYAKIHWTFGMFEDIHPFFQLGMWTPECHNLPSHMIAEKILEFKKLYTKLRLREKGFQPVIAAMANNNNSVSFVAHVYYDVRSSESKRTALDFWEQGMERDLLEGGVPYWSGTSWLRHLRGKLDPGYVELYRAVKQALDPKGIMHPGMEIA